MTTRAFCVIFGVFASSSLAIAQTTLYAIKDGTWTSLTDVTYDIWNTDPSALVGLVGVRPSSVDDVYTNGWSVTIGSGATCKNLAVSYNTINSLAFNSAFVVVTGTLGGWDDANLVAMAPAQNVFSGTPRFTFTGANLDGNNPFSLFFDEVIGYWNMNSPLGICQFSMSRDCVIDGGTPFSTTEELLFQSISVSGGTTSNPRTLSTGFNLTGIRISGTSGATLQIAQNTTLATAVPIYGTGSYSDRFAGTLAVAGTLQTASFVNAVNVNVSTPGTLETTFVHDTEQTQGWWYQTNAPTNFTLNGTVKYTGAGPQKVFLRTYTNLLLGGSGAKELAGSASSMTISRNLTILSGVTFNSALTTQLNIGDDLVCDGTWQPSVPVVFNGASPVTAQSISGSGTLNLSTLQVSNVGVSLLLSKSGLTVSSGLIVSADANLNLGNHTVVISGGDISNSGTVTSGSGTLQFSSAGVTDFTGLGTTTLNNVSVSTGDLVIQSSVSMNDLTLNDAGASVTFSSSATINGNITNNGDINVQTSAVLTFGGGSAQSINGTGFTVYDMIVNKSANTLSNNSTINLLGNLTMSSGTFDADGSSSGNFVLISNTDRDATIGTMTGGQITGEVTFQRYYNNTAKSWRNLGFPVTGLTTAELASSFPINSNSIAYYQENTLGDIDQGWTYLTDGNLLNKYGYSVYMYNLEPITISVKGPLLQNLPAVAGSQYDFGVTYTDDPSQPASQDGWNLVANPFACPIDWNDPTYWVKTNINAVAAVWDATSGAYRYSGTAGWDGIVAQGQAIWVQTNGNPTLQCYEDVKRPGTFDPSFFRLRDDGLTRNSKGGTSGKLSITLENGDSFDEAVVQFHHSAVPEFDADFDAYKLPNQIFNISSLTAGGADHAINVLPKSVCSDVVKLKVSNIAPGSYKLRFGGLATFGDEAVSIRDNFTDKTVRLNDGYVYDFIVTIDAASYGADRFELHFDFGNSESYIPEITKTGRKLTTNTLTGIQWFYNGEPIPNANDRTFIATKAGDYYVEASINGCVARSVPVSVYESSSFKSYPNPADHELNVDVVGLLEDSEESGSIFLYSSKGDIIVGEKFVRSDDIKVLDVKNQKPGLYLLKIFSGSRLIQDERVIIK